MPWLWSFQTVWALQPATLHEQGEMQRDPDEGEEDTPKGSSAVRQPEAQTPWRTPAPAFDEPATPITALAAQGWREVYGADAAGVAT